ncbi:SAM-dependent methyltransferase [Streptomyces sp. NPDC059452]|uniref:SAM-dependent methyltransferase n=1 Tax=Streptomyces sp. NPDC059452 TaxID=3346835 RepID=UPI00369CC540
MDSTEIDASSPHSARVWNFWLGGKDHYPVDEALGRQVAETYPAAQELALASRAFQKRAVAHLARTGIDQFLDLGTGLPVHDSTHEVAQSVNPEARIVYVDNDPLVLAHARALLRGVRESQTAYVDEDLRNAREVLTKAVSTGALDPGRPVAVMILSTLGHLEAKAGAELMAEYLKPLVAGSALVVCDTVKTPETLAAQEAYASGDTPPYWVREPEEILAVAEGLEVLEPGLVPVSHWRPEGPTPRPVDQWGLVALKR